MPSSSSQHKVLPLLHVKEPRAKELLAWYDRHARDLPWRSKASVNGGEPLRADPYRVWLSEIMLQQTVVATVIPYFENFTRLWPSVADLAAAEENDVLKAWAGLGYYARARNLIRCAKQVASEHGGVFPDTDEALQALPGIGPYTSAAIAAIAFGKKATVVDGNVERVMARIYAVETPLPAAKVEITSLAEALTPRTRPGDYAQAVMDLGATICRPKNPACNLCPWEGACQARSHGIQNELPKKLKKKPKPTRVGVVFWAQTTDGEVLLRQRPEKGLLGSMTEIPSTEWRVGVCDKEAAETSAPLACTWQATNHVIRHTFTHFHLELTLWTAKLCAPVAPLKSASPDRCRWVYISQLGDEALPSVMHKVVKAAKEFV